MCVVGVELPLGRACEDIKAMGNTGHSKLYYARHCLLPEKMHAKGWEKKKLWIDRTPTDRTNPDRDQGFKITPTVKQYNQEYIVSYSNPWRFVWMFPVSFFFKMTEVMKLGIKAD